MPNTTLNWNKPTSLPRRSAGDTSEMYMGAVTEDIPTPRPPKNLKHKNKYQLSASAVPIDDNSYKI
jgi:hypothetical protein